MFACLYLPPRPVWVCSSQPPVPSPPPSLVSLAREFSPRLESHDDRVVVLDASGLEGMFGDARALGQAMRQAMADHGLHVHVALAETRASAVLLAHARAGLTIAAAGSESDRLAALPLRLLEVLVLEPGSCAEGAGRRGSGRPRRSSGGMSTSRHYRMAPAAQRLLGPVASAGAREAVPRQEALATLRRWGLRTLGDLAALPPADLFERLGETGLALQRLARGQDPRPLVPDRFEESFEESLWLEWPIDALEPLSFVLGRLLDPLCQRLERSDYGVAVLHLRLRLVTREIFSRTVQLPAPIRDPRTLRTLILLDLESHAPPAGIDQVSIAVDPAPGRIVRGALFDRAQPSPERLSTLLARLRALMGHERCGAARLIDTHRPDAFDMRDFAPEKGYRPGRKRAGNRSTPETQVPGNGLRRLRVPMPSQVTLERGRPARVMIRGLEAGGSVVSCAGPWRTSGQWWEVAGEASSRIRGWDRDGWDVALAGGVYRIFQDRERKQWFVEGAVD